MAPDDKQISRLQSLAQKLNDTSDNLNKAIESLNATLAAMNLGVAVWTERFLEVQADIRNEGDERYEETIQSGYELGYSRVRGDWQIAVRKVVFKEEPNGYGFDTTTYLHQGDPESLLDAPRVVRLEACSCFDGLLEDLSKKAEKYIADVESASKLV